MTVEHRHPRSQAPDLVGEYSNCLLACRLCNQARSTRPVTGPGARLLDPTRDAWREHFLVENDSILAAENDSDAQYTLASYDPNDPRKLDRRRARRTLIEDRLALVRALPGELAGLFGIATQRLRARDLEGFGRIISAMRRIRRETRRALEDLERFPAIPPDAPDTCRCGDEAARNLPSWIERQLIVVSSPPRDDDSP